MPRISQCCKAQTATCNGLGFKTWYQCMKCGNWISDHETHDEASFKAGQQAGRKEVWDYIQDKGYMTPAFEAESWQAKLKEWGIEEETHG